MLTIGRCTILLLTIWLMGYQFPERNDSLPDTTLGAISESLSEVVQEAEQALIYIEGINKRTKATVGRGSGFFVDLEMGYIMTNAHVIRGYPELVVTLADDERYTASVVGRSDDTDIALIKIDDQEFNRQGLKHLTLADSDNVRIGELAIALGAPYGLKSSVSLGIVSGLGRKNGLAKVGNFIQTDVALNSGNSGGPLINSVGEVIGVNTGGISRSGGYDGISFSVPANIARYVALQLIDSGKFESGYLGVNLTKISDDARSFYPALEENEGAVIVSDVVAGSPADQAGVEVGDLIVAVDGNEINTVRGLIYQVGITPPGTVVELVIIKFNDHQRHTAIVKLGSKPSKEHGPQTDIWELKLVESDLGLVVVENGNRRSRLRTGDVIIAVDNVEKPNLEWLAKYLKNRDKVQVRVKRHSISMVIVLHKP